MNTKPMIWPFAAPKKILDDQGVRHIQEVAPPGNYENCPCSCAITHSVESDTWYHKPMVLDQNKTQIAIYRACKECREFLTRDLL